MADTVQMNYNVLKETKKRVVEIAKLTRRNPGKALDWLVAEAYQRMTEVHRSDMTLEQAAAAPATE